MDKEKVLLYINILTNQLGFLKEDVKADTIDDDPDLLLDILDNANYLYEMLDE